MASMKDIKRRKESIQSTQQITKAMKLVSTVKLQKAKARAESSRPYFDTMYRTMGSILSQCRELHHPFLDGGAKDARKAVIAITSNRGLAGGYNSNITKLITKGDFAPSDLTIYAVGKKGKETLEAKGYQVKKDFSQMIESPTFDDARTLGAEVLAAFVRGEISEIYLAYTLFKNTVVHIPTLIRLLPVDPEAVLEQADAGAPDSEKAVFAPMNFEMDEAEALELLIPKYLTSMIYGALLEASASENGARMQAMDSATSNAEDMIDELALLYNRARQGSITQELTEIIAGASAIG